MKRVAWGMLAVAAVAWVNFVVTAILTGHVDVLAWIAATLVTAMAGVLIAALAQPTVQCIECGQPGVPTTFCLGCGRFPKAGASSS